MLSFLAPLQEQIVQLHMEAEGRAKEQSSPAGATAAAKSVPVQSVPVHYQNPYSPPPPQLGRIPSLDSWYALAFAIFICFVGVLIGKSMVSESSK